MALNPAKDTRTLAQLALRVRKPLLPKKVGLKGSVGFAK